MDRLTLGIEEELKMVNSATYDIVLGQSTALHEVGHGHLLPDEGRDR